jgi:hypothetical protein
MTYCQIINSKIRQLKINTFTDALSQPVEHTTALHGSLRQGHSLPLAGWRLTEAGLWENSQIEFPVARSPGGGKQQTPRPRKSPNIQGLSFQSWKGKSRDRTIVDKGLSSGGGGEETGIFRAAMMYIGPKRWTHGSTRPAERLSLSEKFCSI